MSKPVIAQKAPYAIDVEAGKSYWWCACGKSAKQPFCDGAHKGSEFSPLEYKAEKAGTAYFCGCKATKKSPLCDGSHSKLQGLFLSLCPALAGYPSHIGASSRLHF
jgi:CDGSH-type Zn-finger protein